MATPFLAEIRLFGFAFPPKNWATCNGQLISISQNTALFALIGTYYGGNGVNNFALPNLQGRAPLGWGQGPGLSDYQLGESGGAATVSLVQSELPQHSHAAVPPAASSRADRANASNNWLGAPADATYVNAASNAVMNPAMVGVAGGFAPHNNLQPYLTINFCIALQGVFPMRN